MRLILLTAVAAFAATQVISGIVMAQSGAPPGGPSEYGNATTTGQGSPAADGTLDKDGKPIDKSKLGEGQTTTPETKGQMTPQGWSGPINTGTGGAPASSPQGQSPPGMQEAPEGSNKTTVEPAGK